MKPRFESTTSKPAIVGLQYLRAIAALLVVVHHSVTGKAWIDFNPLAGIDLGAIGVEIFFAISGYIIFRVGSRETFGRFVYSRITRIVPLYWLCTALFIASKIASTGDVQAVGASEILKSLFFIPHYSAFRPDQVWPVLIPGWTLNYEMFFYAVFAVGIIFRRPALISISSIIVAIGLARPFVDAGAAPEFFANPFTLFFVLGVTIAKFETRLPKTPAYILVGCVIWASAVMFPIQPTFAFALKLLAASNILLGALALPGPGSSGVGNAFKLLGDASYSIYLVHTIVLAVIYKALVKMNWHGVGEFILVVVAGLMVSILAGLLSYALVERPLMAFFRDVRRRYEGRLRPA